MRILHSVVWGNFVQIHLVLNGGVPVSKFKSLEEIYAAVPKIECRKRCFAACSFIPLHVAELKRITDNSKVSIETMEYMDDPDVKMIKTVGDDRCPLLIFNECSVYELRPLICRMYGVVESMRCQHGCVPERVLSNEEAGELIEAVHQLNKK